MRFRTPITMLVLLGILLGAAWYGWSTVTSAEEDDEPQATEPTQTGDNCARTISFKKGDKVRARTITVNVYNAGIVNGLATETLDDLVDKGFRRGDADNAPTGTSATNVTIVTQSQDSPEVTLVARQFLGKVAVVEGDAIRPGINVIVGDKFRGIDDGAKKKLTVKQDITVCASGAEDRSGGGQP